MKTEALVPIPIKIKITAMNADNLTSDCCIDQICRNDGHVVCRESGPCMPATKIEEVMCTTGPFQKKVWGGLNMVRSNVRKEFTVPVIHQTVTILLVNPLKFIPSLVLTTMYTISFNSVPINNRSSKFKPYHYSLFFSLSRFIYSTTFHHYTFLSKWRNKTQPSLISLTFSSFFLYNDTIVLLLYSCQIAL